MIHRHVAITWEFKIDGECHKTYPATIVNMLLRERMDTNILSWSVTDVEEFVPEDN